MFRQHWKGLLLCTLLAAAAMQSAAWSGKVLSPLLVAILLGFGLGNTVYPKFAVLCHSGTAVAKKQILRSAIVLYGFKLTFHDVASVGWGGFAADAVMVFVTFGLGLWAGRKYFGLDRDSAILIGAGAGICGAAAVLATESLLKAQAYKVSVAVATVVLFGSLAMVVYPLLYSLHLLPFSPEQFGIYIGSSVHEVAQVVAAAGSIAPEVANTAVISKMNRVMLLAPFLLWLSYMLRLANGKTPAGKARVITVPWFALGFIAVVAVHSLLPESAAPVVKLLRRADDFLLAVAMVALGLSTRIHEIRQVGAAPFQLGACLFLWLVLGGALVNFLLL